MCATLCEKVTLLTSSLPSKSLLMAVVLNLKTWMQDRQRPFTLSVHCSALGGAACLYLVSEIFNMQASFLVRLEHGSVPFSNLKT